MIAFFVYNKNEILTNFSIDIAECWLNSVFCHIKVRFF